MDEASRQGWTDRWMWPARHLDWLRPGLRAATEADARRFRQLPAIVASLLALAAIAMPLAFSVGTATSPWWFQGNPYDQYAFLIYDVFTESVPFMLAGLAIGLAAPAAGVLVVLSYATGNLAAAIVTGELEPPLFATIGRLASFALLWLLVVEVPLLARLAAESFGARSGAAVSRRLVAVGGGALVVTGLTWAWALIAPISVQTVFWLSQGGTPFLRPVWTLLYYPHLVIIPAGVIAAAILGARYLGTGSPAGLDLAAEGNGSPVRRYLTYASAFALTGLVLLGVLEKPLDAVILFASVIAVPPLARLILRATRVAPLLIRVPWPVRLIAGVAVAYAVSLGFLNLVGDSTVSRWFHTLFALVISFFIIELLLEAEGAIASSRRGRAAENPAVPTVAAGLFALMTLLWLALPMAVLAHGGSGETDGDAALGAGAAAGGAAAAAAANAARRSGQKAASGPSSAPPRPSIRVRYPTQGGDFGADDWWSR
jgi:hypothetical protein